MTTGSGLDPIGTIQYGLYALVASGRCTEDQISPANKWLEEIVEKAAMYDGLCK